LRARETIRLKLAGKEVERTALFDTGSSYTVIQRAFFERNFGTSWERLSKPVRLYLINGEYVEADKYAQVTIIVNGVELLPPETVLVLDEYAEEVEVEGVRVKLPEVIVGAGTMDKYGILLDPKEGVKVVGAGFLLSSS
jgi:predicted aspartyl protease